MGFVIQTGEKKVKWPVRVHEPIDGGKTKEHEFEVTYGLLTQAEYDKAMQDKLPDHEFIKKIPCLQAKRYISNNYFSCNTNYNVC